MLPNKQCDQMMMIKVAQIFPKVVQNVAKAVFIGEGMFFKIAEVTVHLGYF